MTKVSYTEQSQFWIRHHQKISESSMSNGCGDNVYTVEEFERALYYSLAEDHCFPAHGDIIYDDKIRKFGPRTALTNILPYIFLKRGRVTHSIPVLRNALSHMLNNNPSLGLAKNAFHIDDLKAKMAIDRVALDDALQAILSVPEPDDDTIRESHIFTIAMKLFGGLLDGDGIAHFETRLEVVRKSAWCRWFGGLTLGFGDLAHVKLPELQFDPRLWNNIEFINRIDFDEARFYVAFKNYFGEFQIEAPFNENLYHMMRIPSLKALVGTMREPDSVSKYKDLENLRVGAYLAIEMEEIRHQVALAVRNVNHMKWWATK